MGRGVGHFVQRLEAHVGEGVAGKVVAGVVGNARGTAEHQRLVRRLDSFVTAEQSAHRDARPRKSPVTVAAFQRGGRHRQSLAGKVVVEYLFDGVRAARPGNRAVRAIPVEHEAHEIRRSDHLHFEVGGNFLDLIGRQLADVIVGSDQPGLFGPPPGKAHLVAGLDIEGSHLNGDLQERGGATAVVVDAGTLEHGIEVGPGHNDPVVTANRRFGQDVEGLEDVGYGVHHHVSHDARNGGGVIEFFADGVGNAEHRNGHHGLPQRAGERRSAARLSLVEYQDPDGAGVLGMERLGFERAGSALNQRDVARGETNEIRCFATAGRGVGRGAGRNHDIHGLHECGDVPASRIGHRVEPGRIIGNVRGGNRSQLLEHRRCQFLEIRIVERLYGYGITGVFQQIRDICRRILVPGCPGHPVAPVGVGNGLEFRQV